MTYSDERSAHSRPLLPTDERDLNDQLARMHMEHDEVEVGMGGRSSSNRNMADLIYERKNYHPQVQKALTDTGNFIAMYNHNNRSVDNGDDEDDERISLGSEDNTVQYIGEITEEEEEDDGGDGGSRRRNEALDDDDGDLVSDSSYATAGLTIDPALKRRQDEWAKRGAAQIVKETVNPETGAREKKVIRKGIKDFKFGEMVGDGAYSTVMLATARDSGKKYAVKVLNKEYLIKQKKVKYVNIEKNALQRLNNSRGIVKLFFTFQDESSLYFLLEYAPNGDFLSVMKKYGSLSEECTRYYSAQIIDGIYYLHKKGIIHRDIKPENILLDKDMKVKITDFGTAKILDPKEPNEDPPQYNLFTRSKSFVGTAEYVSPELLNDSYADARSDIWAFGCIVFQMIAGKPPFKATNEYLTFQKVMKVQYAFTAGFPVVIRDLVKRILIKAPEQRLTIPQIEKHHFFKGMGFEDGSIWTTTPPEIMPYKINAKSMQPVPELKDALKRPITLPKRQLQKNVYSSSTPALVPSSDNSDIPTRSESTGNETTKKTTDERTAQILENARKSVSNRKMQLSRRQASGAASAASVALSRKSSQASSIPTRKRTSPSTPVSESTSRFESPVASRSQSNNGTRENSPASFNNVPSANNRNNSITHNAFSPISTIVESPKTESDKNLSNEYIHAHSYSHNQDYWSQFLNSSKESILKREEVGLTIVHTDILEKRILKTNGLLAEPQINGSSRSTLLSQVARGGGSTTGFREASNLPEERYYTKYQIDVPMIDDDYKSNDGIVTPLMSDNVEIPTVVSGETDTPNEEGNTNISGKFKKLFHNNKLANLGEYRNLERYKYYKRTLLLTNKGRLIILVKMKGNDATGQFAELYSINLYQHGCKVRELSFPTTTNNHSENAGYVVVETPYNSFIIRCARNETRRWINTLLKSTSLDNIHTTKKSNRPKIETPSYSSPTVPKYNKPLVSPTIGIPRDRVVSPSTANKPSFPHEANDNNQPGGQKSSRLFDNFVHSRERKTKSSSQVPLSSKLVNGLPTNVSNASAVFGLGLNSLPKTHSHSPQHSPQPPEPKPTKKTITPTNSRLLSRSENILRHK
ncbi:hypothetical protein RNJ44_01932 [Nakaseomyces bracarensis]|uniref:non-specific serine/threonine protein kinase n=1 Tax=Nakaseomyces bracarensis TaxID=273131 RepID=A0ABR4NP70_9SACH